LLNTDLLLLEQRIATAQKEKARLDGENDTATTGLEQVRKDLVAERTSKDELVKSKEGLEAEVARLEEKKIGLSEKQKALADIEKALATIQGQFTTAQKEKARLDGENDTATTGLEQVRKDLVAERTSKDDLVKSKEGLEAEVARLDEKKIGLSEKQKALADIEKALATIQGQFTTAQKEKARLDGENDTATTGLEQVRKDLVAERTSKDELVKSKEGLEAEVARLDEKKIGLSEKEKALADIEKELATTKGELQTLQEQKGQLQGQVTALEKQVTEGMGAMLEQFVEAVNRAIEKISVVDDKGDQNGGRE
jgi:predicted  nucleic acid-binding Zn-ribbon protein